MTTMSNETVATKVLIIEDDPNIVDLIRSNLVVRGFDTVVSVGTKVIALLEAEQPDMVLLDLMLPEADGFELCREIRERSPVAIIVVSARGGERDKVTALNMGADDYMTKPFGIEELLARIFATLRRTRPASEAPLGEPFFVKLVEQGRIVYRERFEDQADRADRTWGRYRRWELSPRVSSYQERFQAMREREVAAARARLGGVGPREGGT